MATIIHFPRKSQSVALISMLLPRRLKTLAFLFAILCFAITAKAFDAMMLPPTNTEFTPQQPIELSFICYLDNLSDQEVVYRIRTYYRTDWSEHQQGEWVYMRTDPVVVPGDDLEEYEHQFTITPSVPVLEIKVEIKAVIPGSNIEIFACEESVTLTQGD